jgi:transposase
MSVPITRKRKPYKTYSKEFKLEALRLLEASDQPASEIARKLGIRRNQLYKWKGQMTKKGDVPSNKKGRPKKENQSDTAKLRQENKRLKEENDISKKAAVYFAKEL